MTRTITDTESLYLSIAQRMGSFDIIRAVKGDFVSNTQNLQRMQQSWQRATERLPHFRRILQDDAWVQPQPHHKPSFQHQPTPIDLLQLPHLPPINCKESSVCLWVFQDGLVFQAAHAVTDGTGLHLLILAFFDSLRCAENGDSTAGSHATNDTSNSADITERELSLAYGIKPKGFLPRWDKSFTLQQPKGFGTAKDHVVWHYSQYPIDKVLQGHGVKFLLAKIVVVLAQWMQKYHPNKSVNCMIPVDLRKYFPEKNLHGNATLPLWVSLKGSEAVEAVGNDIRSRIKRSEPLQNAERFVLHKRWQQRGRNGLFHWLQHWSFRRQRFALNAIVSFLGKYDAQAYSSHDFRCDTVWSSALFSGISPMQLHVTHSDLHVQFHISYQRQLFTPAQIESLFDALGGCKNP